MLPALVGQLVVILKDTALGYVITYPELLNRPTSVGTAVRSNIVPGLHRRGRSSSSSSTTG